MILDYIVLTIYICYIKVTLIYIRVAPGNFNYLKEVFKDARLKNYITSQRYFNFPKINKIPHFTNNILKYNITLKINISNSKPINKYSLKNFLLFINKITN